MTHASAWHRWDVHLHAPGTALHDNFDDDWDGYFEALEERGDHIVGLGITDYCSINTYKEFLARRGDRVPNVSFIFPNIELRMGPKTAKNLPVNIHILVDSAPDDHIARIEEALHGLATSLGKKTRCTRADLIRLGRREGGEGLGEEAAYREGVNQFKIDRTSFFGWYQSETWLREHSLVAIAGDNDGLAGLRRISGFKQVHDELVRNSQLIFSPTPSDIEYFLGERGDDEKSLRELFGGLRPCLHGSDAHNNDRVLEPDGKRYCWIKALPTFEGLRQVVFEPRERVHIGEYPPAQPDPGKIISQVRLVRTGAWFDTTEVNLSPGLTAIIGEKGSGKTALLDLIAAAAGAWDPKDAQASFLSKAKKHLAGATVELVWEDGSTSTSNSIGQIAGPERASEVKYLSQHFVERLCSGDILADELIQEVENVIFDALPRADRLTASNFADLKVKKTSDIAEERTEIAQAIVASNAKIHEYVDAIATLPARAASVSETKQEIERLEGEVGKLLSDEQKGDHKKVEELRTRLSALESKAAIEKAKLEKLGAVESKLRRQKEGADEQYAGLKPDLEEIGVKAEDMDLYRLRFGGNVFEPLNTLREGIEEQIKLIEGSEGADDEETIAACQSKLSTQQESLKLDEQRKKQVERLQSQLEKHRNTLQESQQEIARIERIRDEFLAMEKDKRLSQYEKYFKLLFDERERLIELYRPLRDRMAEWGEAESGLQFKVVAEADTKSWADRGQDMLDLRRSGKLNKPEALLELAQEKLEGAWTSGDAEEIEAGLKEVHSALPDEQLRTLLKDEYTAKDFWNWLYSVEHVKITYTIAYDGVDLRFLSPGNRGIVLLLLYLAVDQHDHRPLLIDQPEENLDNTSVFGVLVRHFRDAKRKRQVLVATHNPNLVINTDAEEVAVAHAHRRKNGLPTIRYGFGALEGEETGSKDRVRDLVCNILEGGEDAFRKREARYGFPKTD